MKGRDVVTGSAGAGAAVTEPNTYGQFLATHGTELMSYAEWIKIVGAAWVAVLIIKTAITGAIWVYRKVKRQQNRTHT